MRDCLNKTKRKTNGITLVALVVTIVVLLILAGVTITMLFGENGIIKKAQEAKEATERDQQETQQGMQDLVDQMDTILNENENGEVVTPDVPDTPETPSGETLLSQITSANYGDKVTYTANGVSDWKVFYKDATNVYIVASDYLSHGGSSNNSMIVSATGMTKKGIYRAYWNSAPTSADTTNHIAKFSPETAETKAWSGTYSTNNNGRCVSTLLDTSLWEAYATGTGGESAIGSPTLNMFVASWNEKYPDDKIYCNKDTTKGYYVGLSTEPNSNCIDSSVMNQKEGYDDTLYYPYHVSVDSSSCYGYWLASPASHDDIIMIVGCNGAIGNTGECYYDGVFGFDWFSLRPVVSLSPGVKGTATTTDGVTTWTLSN